MATGELIYRIAQNIVFVLYLICLFFSIRLQRSSIPKGYLNNFFWYPLVGFFICIICDLYVLGILQSKYYLGIVRGSVLFHYLFLSFFIYKVTEKGKIFRVLIFLIGIAIIFLIITDILYSANNSFGVANSALLAFCIYYFYYLFQSQSVPNLFRAPSFFICCGILFGTPLIIPSSFLIKYLFEYGFPRNLIFELGVIAEIGHMIMILFFIKANSWKNYQEI